MDFLPKDIPLVDFGIALLIGALVGIDRERHKAVEGQSGGMGGLRTFILVAEAGAVASWLALRFGSPWIFAAVGAVVGALVIAGYLAYAIKHDDAYGLTTEIASVVVFLLGGLVVYGFRDLAVVLGIVTSAVLAYKAPLHGLVARLSQEDIFAGLKLLIATFIVLPILPDKPIDPWGAINLGKLWWLVILISALSLAGYVASRWLGSHHGTALTGLFGGLASSTAVTLALARRSKDSDSIGLANGLAAGLLIAWTVMFGRIAAEVAYVHPPLLRSIAVPIGAMGLVVAVVAAVFYYIDRASEGIAASSVPLKNPFSLTSAIKFALVFAAVLLAVKLVQTYWPGRGYYAVAALAGLTNVDAITLSMAEFAKAQPEEGQQANSATWASIAATSITIAAIANTLVKTGLVLFLGSWALSWRVLIATSLIITSGAAAILIGQFVGS
ncbi:MAG: MgtC/SapB family protein [Planctomycetaceae bacterium]|nr:MgtC/SapB family protein [Planctomycetaceae bacterium]